MSSPPISLIFFHYLTQLAISLKNPADKNFESFDFDSAELHALAIRSNEFVRCFLEADV